MYNIAKRTKARKINAQIHAATVRMINGNSGGNLPTIQNAKIAVEMKEKGRKNATRS